MVIFAMILSFFFVAQFLRMLSAQFFSFLLVSKFQQLKGNISAGGSAALDLIESQINAALSNLSENYKLNLEIDF